ncbi:MAG TPA: hypothetical protein VFQ53_26515 [Kofleriaceae bacterium]|nr:hypothetical protein [Kofleriaceae bacterium]
MKTHCPAVSVPAVTPCDPAELAPLVDFLARGEAESRTFPRGTIVDGRVDLCKQRKSSRWSVVTSAGVA